MFCEPKILDYTMADWFPNWSKEADDVVQISAHSVLQLRELRRARSDWRLFLETVFWDQEYQKLSISSGFLHFACLDTYFVERLSS